MSIDALLWFIDVEQVCVQGDAKYSGRSQAREAVLCPSIRGLICPKDFWEIERSTGTERDNDRNEGQETRGALHRNARSPNKYATRRPQIGMVRVPRLENKRTARKDSVRYVDDGVSDVLVGAC